MINAWYVTILCNVGMASFIFLMYTKMFFSSLVLEPMHTLYIHLPYIGWEGKISSQICASMTGTPERHWLSEGAVECSSMIERNFSSKLEVFRCVLQLYIIFSTSLDVFSCAKRKILAFFFQG